jgi:hypothetical protein
MPVTARDRVVTSFVAALVFVAAFGGSAVAAEDRLAPFFEKVKDKGFPVAGRALKDGTGEIDVLKDGRLIRYTIDKDGKVTSAPSPDKLNMLVLKTARFSAAAAARAAAEKEERDREIRVVSFQTIESLGSYKVSVYDGNGAFVGNNRYECVDGRWEGFDDGVGERDPLDPKKPSTSG